MLIADESILFLLTNQHITCVRQSLNQSRVDNIIAVVIPNCSQVRSIAMKCFSRQGIAIQIKPPAEFCCQVLRICCASAIATKINTFACF